MNRFSVLALGLLTLFAAPTASAQERGIIGVGRLFNNDYFGDGHDRWRSGSYVASYISAPRPYDGVGQGFGELLEYRLRGEIIQPSGAAGSSGDRPYVGALSVGIHTHYSVGAFDLSVGADILAVGPQTGLSRFQRSAHKAFSLPQVRSDNQIEDDIFLNGTFAATSRIVVSDGVDLRPFAEVRSGAEELVRVGGDVLIGPIGGADLHLRDVVTGQLYPGTVSHDTGWTLTLGGDMTRVTHSAFLPGSQGYEVADTLTRTRAGIRYQATNYLHLFYGVTRISEEYQGQPEGQTVGSLTLNFTF